MKKKSVFAALALLMMISMLPATALAGEAIPSGGVSAVTRVGDATGDGYLTSADATAIAKHLAANGGFNSVMDTNCDEAVNIDDITRLARRLVGIYSTLCPYGGCWRCDASISHPQPGDYAPGDTMQFGGQSWLVLYVCDVTNHAKILRERVIMNQPYHNIRQGITWENSSSRAWLNNEFYNTFSASDRARIRETHLVTDRNRWGTPGGANTIDKIFSLSNAETLQHFGDSSMYARDVGVINCRYSPERIALNEAGSPSWWWLRSPGGDAEFAAFVTDRGFLSRLGFHTRETHGGGLRPALWLNLAP